MLVTCETGSGKYRIWAEAVVCGRDVCAALHGGTLSHVGGVSLACYEPERDSATVSTLSVYAHRDSQMAEKAAKYLSCELKCTVSVTAGIHVDGADAEEIALLAANCRSCWELLAEKLQPLLSP